MYGSYEVLSVSKSCQTACDPDVIETLPDAGFEPRFYGITSGFNLSPATSMEEGLNKLQHSQSFSGYTQGGKWYSHQEPVDRQISRVDSTHTGAHYGVGGGPQYSACRVRSTSYSEGTSLRGTPQRFEIARKQSSQDSCTKRSPTGIKKLFSKSPSFRSNKGEFVASDITMCEEDRITLMTLVKQNVLSMEQVLSIVRRYEGDQKQGIQRNVSSYIEEAGAQIPLTPDKRNRPSPLRLLKNISFRNSKRKKLLKDLEYYYQEQEKRRQAMRKHMDVMTYAKPVCCSTKSCDQHAQHNPSPARRPSSAHSDTDVQCVRRPNMYRRSSLRESPLAIRRGDFLRCSTPQCSGGHIQPPQYLPLITSLDHQYNWNAGGPFSSQITSPYNLPCHGVHCELQQACLSRLSRERHSFHGSPCCHEERLVYQNCGHTCKCGGRGLGCDTITEEDGGSSCEDLGAVIRTRALVHNHRSNHADEPNHKNNHRMEYNHNDGMEHKHKNSLMADQGGNASKRNGPDSNNHHKHKKGHRLENNHRHNHDAVNNHIHKVYDHSKREHNHNHSNNHVKNPHKHNGRPHYTGAFTPGELFFGFEELNLKDSMNNRHSIVSHDLIQFSDSSGSSHYPDMLQAGGEERMMSQENYAQTEGSWCDVKLKNMKDLCHKVGLEHLLDIFLSNGFETLELFGQLEEEDLTTLGINDPSDRAKVMTAVRLLPSDHKTGYWTSTRGGGPWYHNLTGQLTRDSGCFTDHAS